MKHRVKQNFRNEESISKLWDNFKHLNIYVIGISKAGEAEKKIE